MPLYDYHCGECKHKREHFVFSGSKLEKKCPSCGSEAYNRQLSTFKVDVEYADTNEHYEKKIKPGVDETYEQIGRDTLNNDTKTLDDVFGTGKVKDTLDD